MENLTLKLRISALWFFMAVAMSAHTILIVMQPGPSERMAALAEKEGPVGWVLFALLWLIPLIMAVLSLTLKDSANRWANLVVGIIVTLFNVVHFFECGVPLIEGPLEEPTAHHILLVGSTVVVTALIAWYAWKLPIEEA